MVESLSKQLFTYLEPKYVTHIDGPRYRAVESNVEFDYFDSFVRSLDVEGKVPLVEGFETYGVFVKPLHDSRHVVMLCTFGIGRVW